MSISDLKRQELPLARIKKIMKLDEDVKMISAEAPVLFGKACEMFIHELTMRAWIHTEVRIMLSSSLYLSISKSAFISDRDRADTIITLPPPPPQTF